jgi:hypothetical protein
VLNRRFARAGIVQNLSLSIFLPESAVNLSTSYRSLAWHKALILPGPDVMLEYNLQFVNMNTSSALGFRRMARESALGVTAEVPISILYPE